MDGVVAAGHGRVSNTIELYVAWGGKEAMPELLPEVDVVVNAVAVMESM